MESVESYQFTFGSETQRQGSVAIHGDERRSMRQFMRASIVNKNTVERKTMFGPEGRKQVAG